MSFEMDQELAKKLLAEGAILIFLGVPEETEFGVDMKSWNTAEDFRGVKMIPPGLHFIHYSAVSKSTGDVAPRSGFMHHFKPKEFVIKMWDKEAHDISKAEISEESTERIKSNFLNLEKFLAPYPFDIWQKWKDLSYQITDEVVQKLTPVNGIIQSALELMSCNNEDRPKGGNQSTEPVVITEVSNDEEANKEEKSNMKTDCDLKRRRRSGLSSYEEKEEDLLPNLKPAPGTALRFSEFPLQKYPSDATPDQITKHCLDQTYVLDVLISQHSQPIDIIGELQFTYICFLVGNSLDAFEHWKKMVTLLCSCEEAIKRYRNVYYHFIKSIELQTIEIPEEFLADIVMNNNLIYVKLRDFFRTVLNCEIEDRLKSAIDRVRANLTDKLEWDFSGLEKEEDDEKPVIVDLS